MSSISFSNHSTLTSWPSIIPPSSLIPPPSDLTPVSTSQNLTQPLFIPLKEYICAYLKNEKSWGTGGWGYFKNNKDLLETVEKISDYYDLVLWVKAKAEEGLTFINDVILKKAYEEDWISKPTPQEEMKQPLEELSKEELEELEYKKSVEANDCADWSQWKKNVFSSYNGVITDEKLYKKLVNGAKAGNAHAQLRLAIYLSKRTSKHFNPNEALKLYQAAAENTDIRVRQSAYNAFTIKMQFDSDENAYKLPLINKNKLFGNKNKQFIKWLNDQAKKGEPIAQNLLAWIYAECKLGFRRGQVKTEEILALLEASADSGYFTGQNNLTKFYRTNQDTIPQAKEKRGKILNQILAKHPREGNKIFGDQYLNNYNYDTPPEDSIKGVEHYFNAIELGNEEACRDFCFKIRDHFMYHSIRPFDEDKYPRHRALIFDRLHKFVEKKCGNSCSWAKAILSKFYAEKPILVYGNEHRILDENCRNLNISWLKDRAKEGSFWARWNLLELEKDKTINQPIPQPSIPSPAQVKIEKEIKASIVQPKIDERKNRELVVKPSPTVSSVTKVPENHSLYLISAYAPNDLYPSYSSEKIDRIPVVKSYSTTSSITKQPENLNSKIVPSIVPSELPPSDKKDKVSLVKPSSTFTSVTKPTENVTSTSTSLIFPDEPSPSFSSGKIDYIFNVLHEGSANPITSNRIESIESEISSLQLLLKNVDGTALETLQGKSLHLKSILAKEKKAFLIEQGKKIIREDEKLSDYYYVFITIITDVWMACKTIHSGKVENIEKDLFDHAVDGLDKVAEYIALPGVALLKDGLKLGVKAANLFSGLHKKSDVNRMANYFGTMIETDQFIETIARELTLKKKSLIQSLNVVVSGKFSKFVKHLKDIKNKLTVNDIDTAIKEEAVKDGINFIEAITQDKVKPHPQLDELPSIFETIFGFSLINSISVNDTQIQEVSISSIETTHHQTISDSSFQQLNSKFEILDDKIIGKQKQKNVNPVSRQEHDEAVKKIKALENLLGGSQIQLSLGQSIPLEVAQHIASLEKTMITLNTKILCMEETVYGSSSRDLRSEKQKQKDEEDEKKIREELFNKEW